MDKLFKEAFQFMLESIARKHPDNGYATRAQRYLDALQAAEQAIDPDVSVVGVIPVPPAETKKK